MKTMLCFLLSMPAVLAQTEVLVGAEAYPPVTPVVRQVDLRDLPTVDAWRPGDPIKEIPRRRTSNPTPPAKPIPGQMDPLLEAQEAVQTRPTPESFRGTVNFNGQGFSGVNPPDTTGDVSPAHYIQAINGGGGATFVVYDKSSGAVLAGPTAMESLGSGNCASGYGDPIVLWDGIAQRWVLSEFSSSGNRMCVYVSQTSDPISGGWYHYSFTGTQFPDYPHYGVWPDAYYVGTNESGRACYAFERSKMLLGQAATMQRFVVPDLAGFSFNALTPADLDGATVPPTGAPGILMGHRDDEVHNAGSNNPSQDYLDIYEFHVDWTTPANSTLTGPISIAMAEMDSDLCGLTSFSCFPQPGSGTTLDPLREVIMFRLVYRNSGAHQTLVGSLVTDVSGSDHGGVRWFELRKPGSSWALHQQGTYAPDSNHRWMSSISMDGAGNIALGYNISHSSAVYPGLRYTGRHSGDPLGTLPILEETMVAGSTANGSNRYGDYAQMNVDPGDDSTFWFTGEYNPGGSWATRIASFSFCTPPSAPSSLGAVTNGDNRIDLSWTSPGGGLQFRVYRAMGTCGSSGATLIADNLAGTTYSDTTVSGGITYSYVVRSLDTGSLCESQDSNCDDAQATGSCLLEPTFAGIETAEDAHQTDCAIDLSWFSGTPLCGSTLSYAVYRSTTPGFTPGPANLLASCLVGTSYQDSDVDSGTTYYYVVRAEDDTGNGSGPCNSGIQEGNSVELSAIPTGPDQVMAEDDLEGGTGDWSTAVGTGQSGGSPEWVLQTSTYHSATNAFFVPDPAAVRDQLLTYKDVSVGLGARLEFWQRVMTESGWDGVALEYSVDGGSTWYDILAAGGGIPADSGRILETPYNGTLSGGPLGGRQAWNGNHATWTKVVVDLADFNGYTARFRWRFSSDTSVGATGYWLDDLSIIAATSCSSTCLLADQYPQWPETVNMLELVDCFNSTP